MDREAQRQRPEGAPSGWQRWRDLLFLHWVVSEDLLRPLVPAPLALDTFEGRAFVGVVPFVMREVRPAWLPRPFALDFLETNVRTYVSYRGEPGVFFLSLEASSWLAVRAARAGWSLPYYYAHMSTQMEHETVRYETRRRDRSGLGLTLRYRRGAPLGVLAPDSLEFFLLERYVLFCERRRRLLRGQVHHAPYPAHTAELLSFEGNLMGTLCSGSPALVHYAPGVNVEVFGPAPAP